MRLVLAFDIEKAGPSASDPILAIGASVVNQDFREVDSLFLPCYVPGKTVFDETCWDEFWSKHPEILNTLKYDGILTKFEREHDVIQKFQEFRKKWEMYARENNVEYYLVSDTNVFDAECINHLLFNHLSDEKPIPYSASAGKYSKFINVSDYQRGVLSIIDPEFDEYWGLTDKIEDLFQVPPKKKEYNHNPTNDAYNIAYDFQVLMRIKERTIPLKKMPRQRVKTKKRPIKNSSSITHYFGYGAVMFSIGVIVSMFLRRR